MSMKNISEVFNIDEKTLYRWRKMREKTGNVKPAFKKDINQKYR